MLANTLSDECFLPPPSFHWTFSHAILQSFLALHSHQHEMFEAWCASCFPAKTSTHLIASHFASISPRALIFALRPLHEVTAAKIAFAVIGCHTQWQHFFDAASIHHSRRKPGLAHLMICAGFTALISSSHKLSHESCYHLPICFKGFPRQGLNYICENAGPLL